MYQNKFLCNMEKCKRIATLIYIEGDGSREVGNIIITPKKGTPFHIYPSTFLLLESYFIPIKKG